MIISILIFLVVLSLLVLVHELGHFWMAKRAGIKVEEFGFGIPPRIFGKRIGETIYSINALPFGGFVRLHGEIEEEGVTEPKRAFLNRNKRTRASVLIAGVVMNFLLAIVAFGVVYSFSGIPRETHQVKVVDVAQGSPAETAGVVVGDIITKVGKDTVNSSDSFIKDVGAVKGKSTVFEIQRNGQAVKITMTPRENPPAGQGALGVTITTTEIYFPPVYLRPFYGIYYGFKEALFWGQTIILGLWTIITQLVHGQAPQGVAGPVGIFAVTTEAAKTGVLTLIDFVGILSVNLAILNFIPFPALDGGRLLFVGIEAITGKRVPPKTEAKITTVGMIILLALLVLITFGDVRNLIRAGSIANFLNNLGK